MKLLAWVPVFVLASVPMSWADTLHAYCNSPTAPCTDNGTVTPTNSNTPTFSFSVDPGPQTGDFLVIALIPNNEDPNPAFSFTVNATQAGTHNTNNSLSATASLVSANVWNSGQLDSFLGIKGKPTNPIGAWLPYTQNNGDPGATGFYVYKADLGSNKLFDNPNEASGPLLSFGGVGSGVPLGSVVVGFLNTGAKDWIATANSGALFIEGPSNCFNCAITPEPASWMLLGVGALGLALMRVRKSKRLGRSDATADSVS
jgi:hypothetical protein